MPLREKIWQRLATDLRPKKLALLAHTVEFAQLPEVFPKLIKGEARGRHVIRISAE